MIYDILPVPKPRMTRSDKWKQRDCVMRYRAFCDEVRLKKVNLPPAGAAVTFILPMPSSWSRKKRLAMNGQPHQSKPDLSNMIKALEDALHIDDSHIWNYTGLSKLWGDFGRIIVEVQP